MTYEMIQSNFERGLWNIQMVKIAVKKGIITKEEFQKITGESYS